MRRPSRAWVRRAAVVVLAAVGVNATLSVLTVEHDPALVALLTAATVVAGTLAMAALDVGVSPTWSVHRGDSTPDRGEDTRTTMYRRVIDVHLTSRDADDTIMWQIADLARQRLRQVHGVRYEDSPARAVELLGPELAEWVSEDRRHRCLPGERRRRHSVAQLGEAVRRIEEL